MLHSYVKSKLLKLSLLGALSTGIIITLIAKEMFKNEKADEANE